VRLVERLVDREAQVELLLNVAGLHLQTWIELHLERLRERLAADGQFDLVLTRNNERAGGTARPERRVRHARGIVVTQVPDEAIQPGFHRQAIRAATAPEGRRRLRVLRR